MAWRRWRKSLYTSATHERNCRKPSRTSARDDTTRSSIRRGSCGPQLLHAQPQWPAPRLRRLQHSGAAGFAVLRCSLPCRPQFARCRAQPNAEWDWPLVTRRRVILILDLIAPGRQGRLRATACCCMQPRGQKSNGPRRTGSRSARRLARFELVLPWGTEIERTRSERIAAAMCQAPAFPSRVPLDQVAKLIAGARFVIGVDTGLLHLAAALGVPVVAIFAGSKPRLTGPVGRGPMRFWATMNAAIGRCGHRCGRKVAIR